MLRQLISGDFLSGNCIAVVVLIGLFVALLFRRESITSLGLFRMGYILFLLSLVIPSLVQSFFAFVGSSNGIRSGLSANGTSLAIYTPIGPNLSGRRFAVHPRLVDAAAKAAPIQAAGTAAKAPAG